MIKKLLGCSLLSLSISAALNAQERTIEEGADNQWISVFGHYYRADEEKFENIQIFEEGYGYGLEYGYKFNDNWATRIEWAKIEIEEGRGIREITDESIGLDAMYFVNGSQTYLFGGLRYQDFAQVRKLGAIGLGRHWTLSDRWKLVTEVTGMHDFGEGHRDMMAKVGFAYTFGGSDTPIVLDDDNDGVINSVDRCPSTAAGVTVDGMGCEILVDSDKDGVVNANDLCPMTPTGVRVDSNGCELPMDDDNDGIINAIDQCPNTPTIDAVDQKGCSIFVEKEVEQTLRIYFDKESANVRSADKEGLDAFVAFLNRFPNTDAVIEGHASAPGAADYNMRLSKQRADAARQYLIDNYEIDPDRLSTRGYGETRLLDTANNAEAHEKNRRITARVSKSIRTKITTD